MVSRCPLCDIDVAWEKRSHQAKFSKSKATPVSLSIGRSHQAKALEALRDIDVAKGKEVVIRLSSRSPRRYSVAFDRRGHQAKALEVLRDIDVAKEKT
jgi:hypothetical protein